MTRYQRIILAAGRTPMFWDEYFWTYDAAVCNILFAFSVHTTIYASIDVAVDVVASQLICFIF